jgi:hypothetical protein
MANVPAVPVRQPVQVDPAPVLRVPALRPARVPRLAQADPVPVLRAPVVETGLPLA